MMIAEVRNISKWYKKNSRPALHRVHLSVPTGKTVGLIGESGCGKTTLSRIMLGLLKPDEGNVYFNGTEITRLSFKKKRALRREMQILFQHPDSTFHPRKRLIHSVIEPMLLHRIKKKEEAKEDVFELLPYVGLQRELLNRYPHELSGGQLQRMALVRVLTLKPRFIVLDEPTSMLDVSIQALILEHLQHVQKQFHLSYLFISHDLHVIRNVSDEIAVMYEGEVVETGKTEQLIDAPQHEYTKSLVRAFSTFA